MKKTNRTFIFFLFVLLSTSLTSTLFGQCDSQDWQVLQTLYANTGGGDWTNNTGWEQIDPTNNPATPPANCDLSNVFGLSFSNDGSLVGINLSNNNLTGTLPPELGELTSLATLNLSFNNLTGSLPASFGNLTSLSQFDVSHNDLSGCYDDELLASGNVAEELQPGGTVYSRPVTGSLVVTDFDAAKDQVDVGPQSIHTQIVVDGPTGLTFQNMFNQNSLLILEGVFLKDLKWFNFLPIADAHLQQDLSAALAYENCTGLTRPNTVYVRSHQPNLEEKVNFNPATDKISFFYLLVRGDEGVNFTVEQTAEGATFYSPFTGQTLILLDIDFSELTPAHFEFRANQLEDNLVGRIDLDEVVPGFQVDNNNVFNGKSVPMAGGVDKAPYHIFNHPEYTGTPICEVSNSVLCGFNNAAISEGNNFNFPWEDFCQEGTGICEAPTVIIDSPGENTGFQVGTEVTFSVTALDNDGNITSVALDVNGTPVPASNTGGSTYEGTWTATDIGISTFTATVVDNDGLTATTATDVTIYLTNPPPTASFVATPDYGAPPLEVAFDASSSSDLNGDPLTYTWDFGDGTMGTGVLANHIYPDEGVFTVTLTVDDGNGGTDDFSSPITVVAVNCDLMLEYKTPDTNTGGATDNQIRPHFRLQNTGSSAISLQDVTIRYWYTKEGANAQTAWVDYANVGSENVTTNFVALGTPVSGADHYLEVGFTAGAGSIPAGGNSGEVQTRFAKIGWSNYDETDDYSYNPNHAAFTTWDKVTVYCNGLLTWGTEPDGSGNDDDDDDDDDEMNSPPTASFTVSETTGPAPLQVLFDANASSDPDGDNLTYSWDFGNGATANGSNPEYTYTNVGTYTTALTVNDGNGGTDTESVTITVTEPEAGGDDIEVVFTINSFWNAGYCATVEIVNNGTTTINGWTLDFTHDATINNLWNANWSNNGNNSYTASNLSWNANIPAGSSRSFGYCASHSGSVDSPTNGRVNGVSVPITFINPSESSRITSSGNAGSASGGENTLKILPNPAINRAILHYELPYTSMTQLSIVDPAGKVVMQPVKNVMLEGNHFVEVLTSDLAAGVYFVQLVARDIRVIKPLVIIK